MQIRIEYRDHPIRSPLTPWVHRGLDGPYWRASVFDPPMPRPVHGKGYLVWFLDHRGRSLIFVSPEEIVHTRSVVNSIYVDDRIKDYIVNIVWATRDPAAYKLKLDGLIRCGASPRATINLTLAARAHAFLQGRGYVTPQDVKTIGPDVLRHRILVSYEAEAEEVTSEVIVGKIFTGLTVP